MTYITAIGQKHYPNGIPGAVALRRPASFDEGMGRIWIGNIQCSGNEKMLTNCVADFSGVNSCTHAQDAGVRCLPGKTAPTLFQF